MWIDPTEPADEVCIGRGVTTAVDAGSAGATTFDGFRKFAAEPAQTRLLCILNASMHGLASAGSTGGGGGGELDSLNQVQVAPLVKVIEENRDMVVGIKVRLSADAAANGKNEEEAYRRALEACEAAGVLLMTHHTFSTVPLALCPGADASPLKMRKGDLYTHTFHVRAVSERCLVPVAAAMLSRSLFLFYAVCITALLLSLSVACRAERLGWRSGCRTRALRLRSLRMVEWLTLCGRRSGAVY